MCLVGPTTLLALSRGPSFTKSSFGPITSALVNYDRYFCGGFFKKAVLELIVNDVKSGYWLHLG